MSYYEELGVEATATTEEIRRAYKRLTRLLHPDHQLDPELRAAAERQMRRLNQIQDVLTNPESRARYDRELTRVGLVLRQDVAQGERRKSLSMGWVWVLSLVAIIILVAVWFPAETYSPPAAFPVVKQPAPTPVPSPVNGASGKPMAGARAAGASRSAQRPVPEAAHVEAATVIERPAEQTRIEPMPVALPLAKAPLALNPVPFKNLGSEPDEKTPRKPTLAGQWIYARSAKDRTDEKLYPPEYIELRVVEKNGRMTGNYQARYFVSDRAVSPNVTFRFEGETKEGGEFSWEGAGGARGKIELKTLNAQTMEVVWFATEMGSQLGLGSGSATLYRRQDP